VGVALADGAGDCGGDANLLAIQAMASRTRPTRVVGYLWLRNRGVSAKATADLASLAVTMLAAPRLSLLPTILMGVASAGILRHLLV
jgi:uncharacterized membrane protein